MVSYVRLRELLEYDPEYGVFTWAISHGFKKHGTETTRGRITLDGKTYRAGRLAWFYTHGRWPGSLFRHVNGDIFDSRLCNLANTRGKRVKVKQTSGFWVRMTRTETGYALELTQKHTAPVDLGNYPTYEQAAAVQRMILECSS